MPTSVARALSPRTTAVSPADVVLTGCGRLYVFPPHVPRVARRAGFNHFAHRVGYVEPAVNAWVARDLGTRPLGMATASRTHAAERVLEHAGWHVYAANWPQPRLIGRAVPESNSPTDAQGDIYVDAHGRVFVSRTAHGPKTTPWRRRGLGAVWPSGDGFGALRADHPGHEMTVHDTHTAALQAILPAGSYLFSRGR